MLETCRPEDWILEAKKLLQVEVSAAHDRVVTLRTQLAGIVEALDTPIAATPVAVSPPTPPVDAKPAATATPAQPRTETLEAALERATLPPEEKERRMANGDRVGGNLGTPGEDPAKAKKTRARKLYLF